MYGIRASKTGVDASSGDSRHIILRTDKPVLKLKEFAEGTITMPAGSYGSKTISHNLGYQPIVIVFFSKDVGDTDNYILAHNGAGQLQSDYQVGFWTTTSDLELRAFRIASTPAGEQSVNYVAFIFYDPDDSIAGKGSNVFTKDGYGILISKDGIDLSGAFNEDDLVFYSGWKTLKLDEVRSDSVTSGDTINIPHGKSYTPVFLGFFREDGDDKYYMAGSYNSLGTKIYESWVNDTNIVFKCDSVSDFIAIALIFGDSIAGTPPTISADDYGIDVSVEGSSMEFNLAEDNIAFTTRKQTLQPYQTLEFTVTKEAGSPTGINSVSHPFGFPPAFTGRYDGEGTWVNLPLIGVSTENVIVWVDDNKVYGLLASDSVGEVSVNIQVMLYPIDLSA